MSDVDTSAAAVEWVPLSKLLQQAQEAYDRLSPVDKALYDDERRRSFVKGMGGVDPGPSVLAEEVKRLRAERDAATARAEEAERKLAEEDRAHDITLSSRDAAEAALNEMFFAVMGHSPEWSSMYDFDDALHDVDDRLEGDKAALDAATARAERMREAHAENARLLALVIDDLQGHVEGGKLSALMQCLERARAALGDRTDA